MKSECPSLGNPVANEVVPGYKKPQQALCVAGVEVDQEDEVTVLVARLKQLGGGAMDRAAKALGPSDFQ